MRTAYKVRAYPDPEQAALLSRTFGCVRVVWNRTLAERQRRYATEKRSTSYRETDAELVTWKRTDELSFLGEVSSVPQRRIARCQRDSNNRTKAKRKVARAHSTVRAARRDFLHQTSTNLVRRFDRIGVEDLNVAGMVRNQSLAKAISDVGWGEFRTMLEYKATRVGRVVVAVDRWYPSSKTCSTCGHLLASLSLGTRHWTCPGCGSRHQRDENAAKNIDTAAGLVAAASGGPVRPDQATGGRGPVNEEPPQVTAGLPRF